MRDLLDAMTAIGAAVFTMDEGDGAPKFEQPILHKLR